MKNYATGITAIALVFPLFFTSGLEIYRGDSFSGEFALPFSLFFVGLLIVFQPKNIFKTFLRRKALVLYISSIILLFFSLFSCGTDGIPLFLLYLWPMFSGITAGYFYKLDDRQELVFLKSIGITALFISILHIAASFFEYGIIGAFLNRGSDSIFGWFSIYQKFNYFATILAFSFAIILRSLEGLWRTIGLLLVATDIVLTGSREAMLLVIFFQFIFIAQNTDGIIDILKRYLILTFFLCLAIAGLLSILGENIKDITFFSKITDLTESGSWSAGREDAAKYIYDQFDINVTFLLFGTGFNSKLPEIGTPHNQYLEWHLRGGILFILINISMIAVILKKTYTSNNVMRQIAFALILGVSLISNNINTPFRTPYTSIFLWFVCGLTMRSRNPTQVTRKLYE
jgi:hypothetical protein